MARASGVGAAVDPFAAVSAGAVDLDWPVDPGDAGICTTGIRQAELQ